MTGGREAGSRSNREKLDESISVEDVEEKELFWVTPLFLHITRGTAVPQSVVHVNKKSVS